VATALLLRIYQGKGTWLLFAGLGVALGVAYLAKTAMFPISFAFLACGFLLLGRTEGSYPHALARSVLATAVFLSVASPLILALSKEKHRVTLGDSGAIAYAELVNGARMWTHWQGEPPGTGSPAHATRKVLATPPIYEFAEPIAGSYPPWYDPSYWYEGIRPHFSWKGQLWVLFRSANSYLKLFSRSGALYAVFLALIVQVGKAGRWDWGASRMSLVWLPSLAALTMYALVLVEQRYVSPFAVMLLAWVLTTARFSASKAEALRKGTAPVVVLALVLAMAWPVTRDLRDTLANRPYEPWEVAVGLHKTGISAGARVGSIGTGLSAYWAHLAGVQIIAEVPERDQTSFSSADPARKEEALRKFSELGARAVVMKNSSAAQSMEGWQEVGGTHYYVWRPAGH
jgi:4-amino-4-deoxy-L-arabinose transferase-like glycosyltransferase